jgi:hypothetical protein
MFNNPFQMVVAIVAIVMIANVLKARYRARHGIIADENGNERTAINQDAARLRDEVKILKDRIAVLERLATDENGPKALEREIEKLR